MLSGEGNKNDEKTTIGGFTLDPKVYLSSSVLEKHQEVHSFIPC